MCDVKPRPRCSNHALKTLDASFGRLSEAKKALAEDPENLKLVRAVGQAKEQWEKAYLDWAETKEGQQELDLTIADLKEQRNSALTQEKRDKLGQQIDRLQISKEAGLKRATAKNHAANFISAGKEEAAEYCLRHGADSAWMAKSRVPAASATKLTGGREAPSIYATVDTEVDPSAPHPSGNPSRSVFSVRDRVDVFIPAVPPRVAAPNAVGTVTVPGLGDFHVIREADGSVRLDASASNPQFDPADIPEHLEGLADGRGLIRSSRDYDNLPKVKFTCFGKEDNPESRGFSGFITFSWFTADISDD